MSNPLLSQCTSPSSFKCRLKREESPLLSPWEMHGRREPLAITVLRYVCLESPERCSNSAAMTVVKYRSMEVQITTFALIVTGNV